MKTPQQELEGLQTLYNKLEKLSSPEAMELIYKLVDLELRLEEQCNR